MVQAHLRTEEGGIITEGTRHRIGGRTVETTFTPFRCTDQSCGTRWLRIAAKSSGAFVEWRLAAQSPTA